MKRIRWKDHEAMIAEANRLIILLDVIRSSHGISITADTRKRIEDFRRYAFKLWAEAEDRR